ncbi:glycosyltransferase family 4 protein [Dinghuibacter silviterrae]|uniref:Glycosyltransferase involved in cell wall biosynthesis n=1 Tax=Dinghuibacter silviterrae TaxID=1539049 RepID=A0A4R8DRL0_9BACT|nr:glycosyltransferase family 4 protein [Dinghuibacter silviterrae]TDX00055.1 glycosyltransferase involved in cell wall biosynthesis [Dinghuibacter silviterrae]
MNRKMDTTPRLRSVYFTHYTSLYGANRSLLNLLEGLSREKDMELVLVAPEEGPVLQKARGLNVKCIVLPFFNEIFDASWKRKLHTIGDLYKFLYNWGLVFRHFWTIKGKGKTMIHTNSSVTFIGAYFAFFLRVDHIWHIREFAWDDYGLQYNFGRKYFEFWLKRASAVVSVSKAVRDKRVSSVKLPFEQVVYNGVVFEKHLSYLESRQKIVNGKTTFAIVGGVVAPKNILEALEAFALVRMDFKNTRLLVVGDGQDYDYMKLLKGFVSDTGLGADIQFTGFVEDMSSIYEKIDVLLMCSHNEALGRVTIEAMSYGIPVIGYNAGGTREIIVDHHNGLFYEGGSVELSEKMKWLLTERGLGDKMRKNCIQSVREHFTIERYMSNIYNIYSVLNR